MYDNACVCGCVYGCMTAKRYTVRTSLCSKECGSGVQVWEFSDLVSVCARVHCVDVHITYI